MNRRDDDKEQRPNGPTDLEIVKQVRWWIDSNSAEIDNRYLRRVCWLAEQEIKGRTVKALSTPSATRQSNSDLLKQARRVRNYSDPSEVFEAVPVSCFDAETSVATDGRANNG